MFSKESQSVIISPDELQAELQSITNIEIGMELLAGDNIYPSLNMLEQLRPIMIKNPWNTLAVYYLLKTMEEHPTRGRKECS